MNGLRCTSLVGLAGAALLAAACESPPAAVRATSGVSHWEQATDRMTGGGKLGDGHDFATFGFNARSGQGQIEWVQHCLDGVDPSSPTCQFGAFHFHGNTVTDYFVSPDDPEHCRSWTGSGEAKFGDAPQYDGTYDFSVDKACDYGEPGVGTDYMSITIGAYHREGLLNGGNLQLHKS